jgi:hypothetical protein
MAAICSTRDNFSHCLVTCASSPATRKLRQSEVAPSAAAPDVASPCIRNRFRGALESKRLAGCSQGRGGGSTSSQGRLTSTAIDRIPFSHQEVRFSVRLVQQTSWSDLDRIRISIGHDVALRSPLDLLGPGSALKRHRSTSLIFHVRNRQESASTSPSNLTQTSTALSTLFLVEAPHTSMAK